MNTRIFYHKDCPDGFGAAYATWKRFGVDATYHPYVHHEEVDVGDADAIYFLDVTPEPIERLRDIAREVAWVKVIDHHATTLNQFYKIANVGNLTATIGGDNKSAAVLSWEYFHGKVVPPLLLHIQDYDLWKFQLPNTREIVAALRMHPFDFEVWDEWIARGGEAIENLSRVGDYVLKSERVHYRRAMKHVQWIVLPNSGYPTPIPMVNTSTNGTEVANELLEIHKVPVAGYYYDTHNIRHWSLRSNGTVDVGKIALAFGGGGHKGAAGFETLRKLEDELTV